MSHTEHTTGSVELSLMSRLPHLPISDQTVDYRKTGAPSRPLQEAESNSSRPSVPFGPSANPATSHTGHSKLDKAAREPTVFKQ